MTVVETEELALAEIVHDTITGFTGTICSILTGLEEPPMYHVENADGARWLPLGRLKRGEAS